RGGLRCEKRLCRLSLRKLYPAVTFGKLLDKKYMDKNLRKMYGNKDGYKVSSAFNVSFGIIGAEDCGVKSGSAVYPCESYTVGKSKLDYIGIRLYDYDEKLFPKDRRVIQCNIPQDNEDYEYWKNIYNDKERYNAEKQRIAETIKTRITRIFPELENRLVLLDTYSPCTFTKWCGAYKGAYMSFFEQKGYKSLTAKNTVKGLSNVFLASQWLTTNGGLPVAVTQGKFAADSIAKHG
ncbi:MAG: NAD(P)/FAD-dependent oxidoreductase, partial [Oscillospiraceae bacterium]|nr:NAD(P)/FAD-dependent oxidoreductase [Oscillospiraceae bacterium]